MDESYLDDGTTTDGSQQGNDILDTISSAANASASVINALKPNPPVTIVQASTEKARPGAPIPTMWILGFGAVLLLVLVVKK